MTTISKQFVTETAHIVREAVSERCKYNLHGHSYRWEVAIEGPVAANGMVLDFKELQPVREFIDQFDHATVFWSVESVDVVKFFTKNFKRVLVMNKNCTAENMASLLHAYVSQWLEAKYTKKYSVSYIKVWETEKACAIATSHSEDDFLCVRHGDLS